MKTVIEILYPEFNNLFGDRGNAEYLKARLERADCEAEIIETYLFSEPNFVNGKTDILLIGPCTEKAQLTELEELKKYSDAIKKRIENGEVTLATGNAFELFGEYIENPKGEKTECLGIFPYYAKQFSRLRFNDNAVGDFNGMKITGFKNLLSFSYGENPFPFLKMEKGIGMNKETKTEGVHKNNFFATYHTGPILPLNPDFTDYLIRLCRSEFNGKPLSYEKTAYDIRIKELLG